MADNSTLIAVSAFSGLAGALLTQMIGMVNTYFVDKRKQDWELATQLRLKKIEIGESFFFVTGEMMTAIKKNIGYWKNWNNARTEKSLEFLHKETFKFNTYMEKLNMDNWKFNLISLYFNVLFTNDEVVLWNMRSRQLYLLYIDLAEKIRHAEDGDEKEKLYQQYAVAIFDMCAHYEEIYNRLEHDMNVVRTQLLNEFVFKPVIGIQNFK
ncbi:hypothetical protein AB6735_27220 [Mucilaginibacter sp. RCC_168]|uniref:hypothetical protein n=1 Tax=Mucilaginibacter sp. RCC_168 TaxID=3239221 RepID=UPI003524EE45